MLKTYGLLQRELLGTMKATSYGETEDTENISFGKYIITCGVANIWKTNIKNIEKIRKHFPLLGSRMVFVIVFSSVLGS